MFGVGRRMGTVQYGGGSHCIGAGRDCWEQYGRWESTVGRRSCPVGRRHGTVGRRQGTIRKNARGYIK